MKTLEDRVTRLELELDNRRGATVEWPSNDTHIGMIPEVNSDGELELQNSRMNWKGTWIARYYNINDVVRTGDWTMIANKYTNEIAEPVWVDPDYTYPDDWDVVAVGGI